MSGGAMSDVWFAVLAVGLFAVAGGYVEACRRLSGDATAEGGSCVTLAEVIGLLLGVALVAYLVVALIGAERS